MSIKIFQIAQKSKLNRFIRKATQHFLAQQYESALKFFNEALILDSESKEAQMGILLCDVAQDNEDQAQKLFEYYQLTKSQKLPSPEENIINLIGILDRNTNHFVAMLNDYEESQINDIDGILYSDFKKLIEVGENFKQIFEYAMFSTKIIFTKKSDFYEFLNLLIDNGLGDISMQYIESLKGDIINDSEIQKIIKKALKTK